MAGKIYTIGETVLDIIFKDRIPVSAKPGGAMLNVAVSLGRANLPIHFISEFATDEVGTMIHSFLIENNISTDFIYRFQEGKSALALAFLDKNQNAAYSFYKSYPAQRLNISVPEFHAQDILIFGSFYGISPDVRAALLKFLQKAKDAKALIVYDPNFRKSHLDELPQLLPAIEENIRFADIVKGSDEDFKMIYKADTPQEAFSALADDRKILFYTAGNKGSVFFSRIHRKSIPAKSIVPVSTIGAGDNFNAGVVYGLYKNQVNSGNLEGIYPETWEKILEHGHNFASEVCMSYDNYLSVDFFKNYIINNQ